MYAWFTIAGSTAFSGVPNVLLQTLIIPFEKENKRAIFELINSSISNNLVLYKYSFVYTLLNVNTVLFQTIHFRVSTISKSKTVLFQTIQFSLPKHFHIYIYMCVCVCVCVWKCINMEKNSIHIIYIYIYACARACACEYVCVCVCAHAPACCNANVNILSNK